MQIHKPIINAISPHFSLSVDNPLFSINAVQKANEFNMSEISHLRLLLSSKIVRTYSSLD